MSFKEHRLRSEALLHGKLIHAFRDEVALPQGGTAVREWIRHPGAAAVVPLFDDGTTLLVRQYRYAPDRVFLEVPAGKMDREGEAPEVVAARELEEETGWKARELIPLGAGYPCIGYSNEVIHCFLARGLHPGTQRFSEGEWMEVVRLPLNEAIEQARKGTLVDMKTVTALTWAAAFLEAGSTKNEER